MKNKKIKWVWPGIFIFSILFFLLFYGASCLDPQNTDWLLSGGLDISQHYAGWMFYGKDPWMFPVGNFTSLSNPNPMSVIYMDSIPLFAVIFKLLRPLLPGTFQYFGWYQLLCFALQGMLGAVIARKYCRSDAAVFLAGALTVMTPAFLWRVFLHVALSSHWILLLALLSVFCYEEYFEGQKKRKIWFWGMLGFFCCMIHLYFLPMCFIILLGFLYLDIRAGKRAGKEQAIVLTVFWSGVLLPMFLMGGFLPGMDVSDLDFTWKKTFNLNGFFNPQGWSRVLPDLQMHTYGQSEGFAYLGIGVLLCILAAAGLCIGRWMRTHEKPAAISFLKIPKVQALLAIAILSAGAAVSPVITFGSRAFIVPFPKKLEELWMVFRCSGRLVWPAVYIFFFGSLVILSGCKKKNVLSVCLLACAVLQGVDISEKLWERGSVSREPEPFVSELQDEGWQAIGTHPRIRNIVYINTSGLRSCASMAEFADRYGMTLGKFYYARNYETVTDAAAAQALAEKKAEDIFLFDEGRMIDAWNEPDLYFYLLDGKLLGYSEPVEGLEKARIDVREYAYAYGYEITPESEGEEIIDGFLFLHAGGKAVSPMFRLPEGMYGFTVEGENMEDADISVTVGELQEREMQTLRGQADVSDTEYLQIEIRNPSDHDMVLYQVVLQPMD